MSSTAFDDQFLSPPDYLETECREARLRVKNVCVWNIKGMLHNTSCGSGMLFTSFDISYRFCPFCGKRIEVKK